MPTYSYGCEKCSAEFELFFYIKDYQSSPKCSGCGSKKTYRCYIKDVATQNTSVKKSDTELKTIGDLANRNRDKMSEDEKIALHNKHNSYKEEQPVNELPKGMKRLKKQPKIKWT
jgi:putative FmdB family regulatory protein